MKNLVLALAFVLGTSVSVGAVHSVNAEQHFMSNIDLCGVTEIDIIEYIADNYSEIVTQIQFSDNECKASVVTLSGRTFIVYIQEGVIIKTTEEPIS